MPQILIILLGLVAAAALLAATYLVVVIITTTRQIKRTSTAARRAGESVASARATVAALATGVTFIKKLASIRSRRKETRHGKR